MKRKRFTEEQIIGILKEHEAGVPVADLCHKHGVSDASIYKWKARFGGMDVSEAKRLRSLEDENTKLKRLLARRHVGQCGAEGSRGKECMTRPARARSFNEDDAVCTNVSGLLQVGRCCGQAMMRSARAVLR
ncbi:transposase-like protein [Bradyrhizobium centrosematis]|nr:transposase-like protein [Bradyrhizobium centrosematis]MCS3778016.1 transposase-like protein [Bradyrhizobium centrosematis]